MKLKSVKEGYWVKNLSKIDLHLYDLNVSVNAGQAINLQKYCSIEDIEKSVLEGDIKRHGSKLKIIFNLHTYEDGPKYEEYKGPNYRPIRVMKQKEGEEELFSDSDFFVSDEKFVEEIIKDLGEDDE